jgi:hypothetical protein
MKARALSEKMRRFVEAYAGSAKGNATQAAIAAGTPARSAGEMGSRWLKRVKVQRAIAARVQKREERGLATDAEIDQFFTDVMRDEALVLADRIRAADLLCKVKGRYSLTHILRGKLTIADALETARGRDDVDLLTLTPARRGRRFGG